MVILKEILPPGHPQIADVLYYIGGVEYRLHRYQASIVHLQEAYGIALQVYGAVHPQLVTTLITLGRCYVEQGQIDSATVCLDLAISATGFDGKKFTQSTTGIYWPWH